MLLMLALVGCGGMDPRSSLDGGPVSDAGTRTDAGTSSDVGTRTDVGTSSDVGTITDAHVVPRADAVVDAASPRMTIAATLSGRAEFSIFVAALGRLGMLDLLDDSGGFTVFAPTNDAFARSSITLATVETVPLDSLSRIVSYHLVALDLPSAELEAGPTTSWAGLTLIVGTTGGVTLNGGNAISGGANVVTADVAASNGWIHIIDRLLMPPTVVDMLGYAGASGFLGAIQAAAEVANHSGEGPFTIFAPTNAAIAETTLPSDEVLTRLVRNHIVAQRIRSAALPARAATEARNIYGNNLTMLLTDGAVNGAAGFVVRDLIATNGVVHLVDAVLEPMNLVDAIEATNMSGMLRALELSGPMAPGVSASAFYRRIGPYTIFAPATEPLLTSIIATDPEFADELIRDMLRRHTLDVASFRFPQLSARWPMAANLRTLAGTDAILDTTGPDPRIQGIRIVQTDLVVTNGVIHEIAAVMSAP